jgi:hypothetical protein
MKALEILKKCTLKNIRMTVDGENLKIVDVDSRLNQELVDEIKA